jgi:predicted MFS family arabinose efflux permease
MSERLFTPRFFIMCAYSFTVFVSVFQLLPTAPYHIIDLGGSRPESGLFLGFLAFASAASAPFTGSIGDRLGQRRVLIVVSLILAGFTLSYTFITDHRVLLALVIPHGLVWSALLSAQGAYMTQTVPESRRAEGISYWGLASVLAVAGAPSLGFWIYRYGWAALTIELTVLNLLMAVVAWRLPDDRAADHHAVDHPPHYAIEWRVLLLSVTMAMISFGYGALTSFSSPFADHLHVWPRGLFLTGMAAAVLTGRLTIGRSLDRIGHRRILLRCSAVPAIGIVLLALSQGTVTFLASALVFGAGFGLMHPAYTAYVMAHVSPLRRGAAFGAMIAAFDTGIGSGSSAMGWFVHHIGYRWGFAAVAVVAALALPMFLIAEKRLGFARPQ